MKSYTFYDTGKNGGLTQINFKVPEEGIILTSGPLAREGVYRIDGDRIIKDSNNYDSFVINCIDIDWNECLVDANTTIKTTADLIRWIRQIVKNAGSFDPANFSLDGSILYYGKRDDPSRIKIYDDSESTPWLDDLDWITTNMIKDNAITTPKLADRSVTEPKLANNAVSTRTIQNGAVTGDKLASEILEYTPNGTSNTTTTFGTLKLGNNNQVDITFKGDIGSGGIADLGGSEYVPVDEEGIKLGTLNLKTTDNTELASIDIYGLSGGNPGGGGNNPEDPEGLPEELELELDNIRQTVLDVENQLDDIHIKSKQDVQNAVDEMFDTWDWFIAKGFPVEEVFNYDNEDFRGAIGETISGLGYLKDDDNGVTYTKIKQFINGDATTPGTLAELTTSVGDITRILDPNDPSGINYETLGTEVSQKITQDVNGLKEALLDLQAFWGTTDEDKELMQYMKSAFSAAASQYTTAATMFSDMEDAAGNTATSAVKTTIGIDANGNLTAGGLLASKIQQGVNSAVSSAGFAYQSDVNSAFAQMFAKNTDKNNSLIAAVRTAVTDADPVTGLKTAIGSLVATPNADDMKAALAGVFVECGETGENALVNIIASDKDGVTSKILTEVKNGKGNIKLTSDDITFDGNTTVTQKLTALLGLITTSAEANLLHSWNGDITTQFNKNSNGAHVVIEKGEIEGYNVSNGNSQSKYKFANDGSGYVANQNIKWNSNGSGEIGKDISWDTEGNVTINGLTAALATLENLDVTTLATIAELDVENLHARTLHSYSGSSEDGAGYHVVISNGELVGYNQSTDNYSSATDAYRFNNDGSGFIANGTLRWDEDGNTLIGTNGEGGTFNVDGSGSIANGNIEWISNGNLSVKTGQITIGGEGYRTPEIIVDSVTMGGKGLTGISGDDLLEIQHAGIFCGESFIADIHTDLVDCNKITVGTNTSLEDKHVTIEHGKITVENDIEISGTGRIYFNDNNDGAWITDFSGSSSDTIGIGENLYVNGQILTFDDLISSDATMKDITSDVNITVEQIANAPAVNFTWKRDADKENKKEHAGTLAQYWQVILPQVVSEGPNNKLAMSYGNAAMVSSIVTAKEVVALKQENEDLKQRISQLEEWVNNLRNSLNN